MLVNPAEVYVNPIDCMNKVCCCKDEYFVENITSEDGLYPSKKESTIGLD